MAEEKNEVYTSLYPDVQLRDDVTLHDFIADKFAEMADRVAIIDSADGRQLTYGEVDDLINRAAAGWQDLGAVKGDALLMYSANNVEYIIAFLGWLKIGGVVSPANPRYTPAEVHHQLELSDAKFLLSDLPCLERAVEAVHNTQVERIFVFGDAPDGADVTPFQAVLDNEPVDSANLPEFDPKEDIACLPFSSGTTGLSKGVMLTHYNIVSNIIQISGLGFFELSPEDRVLLVLPLYHIYGLVVIAFGVFSQGAAYVVMGGFDPVQFLTTIQTQKLTILPIVPPIVLFLAKHPAIDKFDLSSVKQIVSGAAPLGDEVATAVVQRLGLDMFRQGYGMTELSPVTHLTHTDTYANGVKYGAVGRLVPNCELKVIDPETGNSVAQGERGELWVRGPNVMKGYIKNEEATNNTIDADGFLHTGDICYMDEDGDFYIVDRLKELIKYKGFQVPPAELEALLMSHENIADAAVVPFPDDEAGELPKAFIVLKPDIELSEQDIMDFVAANVSAHKRVRLVEFIDQIPKSASGKILRRILRDRDSQ